MNSTFLNEIMERGCQELDLGHPSDVELITPLIMKGFMVYHESLDENGKAHCYKSEEMDFSLGGSMFTKLIFVYDPKRWVVR